MQCTVQWEGSDGMAFTAHTETGHTLRMDGAPASAPGEPGGHNLAPRPMETVLVGTGGCTAYDVVFILKKARQDVRGCTVRLDAERATADPKVFTRIHMHFVVTGVNLREDMVRRAVELSHTKYCSASAMLEKTAVMTFDIEIKSSEI
ncbi:OsmC family protein [Thiomonas intermedia]|uniref:OsmC family protein n=1 Tax=Thiomonas intermedia TaxID=926 RepID=UPI0009A54A18|nr:OsmC family protein [Thiomonas intermedia]